MGERRVYTAEQYRHGAMGSFGKADGMLLSQRDFPDTFDERDKLMSADHDRCFSWDHEHTDLAFKTHTKGGPPGGFEQWAQGASAEAAFAFLKDVLKAKAPFEDLPDAGWTGYRLLGTVNRSNGYPVWSFQLFAKHPETKTAVYTGPGAPNVHQLKKRMMIGMMGPYGSDPFSRWQDFEVE